MEIINLRDEISPINLYKQIRKKFKNTVLLESLEGPHDLSKQSIICFEPEYILEIKEGCLYSSNDSKYKRITSSFEASINFLRDIISKNGLINDQKYFVGGFLGFTSYDIVQ